MTKVLKTVSIIICGYTYDRRRELQLSICSAFAQQPPVDEVIVVIDHNPELEAELRAEFPEALVIPSSGQPGLSAARNTGINAARGDLLVFLDDDAKAEPDFVAKMVPHFSRTSTGGVTAQVTANWHETKPCWFPDEFLWVVGCSQAGKKTRKVRNLLGAGMCIRREVFDRVGLFDCDLGRKRRGLPMGGEETEICIRARTRIDGLVFLYEPSAVVQHQVKGERLTWSYFMKRCLAEGLSKAQLARRDGNPAWLNLEREYVLKTIVRARVADARAVLRGDFDAVQRILATGLGISLAAVGFGLGWCAGLLTSPFARSAVK